MERFLGFARNDREAARNDRTANPLSAFFAAKTENNRTAIILSERSSLSFRPAFITKKRTAVTSAIRFLYYSIALLIVSTM